MGKLSNLQPTMSRLAPRLGFAEGDAKAADKSRNQLSPWRTWYKSARWLKLRQVILLRDLYQCQMCGRIGTQGMVVDHVRPHRGDEALFWAETNLQVLCSSPCHSKHKQALERAS